jgi:hypothetical protein
MENKFLTITEDGEIKLKTYTNDKGKEVPIVKHLPGKVKNYRFDGKSGYFKIGEDPIIITNDKGKQTAAEYFELTPIAFRVFEENLFARNKKDLWIELFFLDEKNTISSIMFNNTSAKSLQDAQFELFIEDLSLIDVRLKITSVEKTGDKGSWKMAKFDYEILPIEETKELQELESYLRVHNQDTLTETAVFQIFEGSFFKDFVSEMKALKE